jgi:hypothetical protein
MSENCGKRVEEGQKRPQVRRRRRGIGQFWEEGKESKNGGANWPGKCAAPFFMNERKSLRSVFGVIGSAAGPLPKLFSSRSSFPGPTFGGRRGKGKGKENLGMEETWG